MVTFRRGDPDHGHQSRDSVFFMEPLRFLRLILTANGELSRNPSFQFSTFLLDLPRSLPVVVIMVARSSAPVYCDISSVH